MKKQAIILVFLGGIVIAAGVWGIFYLYSQEKLYDPEPEPPILNEQEVIKQYGKLPLSFQENKGQVDEVVKFLVRTGATTIFFTRTEVVYQMIEQPEPDPDQRGPRGRRLDMMEEMEEDGEEPEPAEGPESDRRVKGVILRHQFVDANNNPVMTGEDQLEGKINYFVGNNEDEWVTEAATFTTIRYQKLYKGIDLVYTGSNSALKFEYHISPGADYSKIVINVEGANGLTIAEDGALVFETELGNIGQPKPETYQMINGKKVTVNSAYKIIDATKFTFNIAGFDDNTELIVTQ